MSRNTAQNTQDAGTSLDALCLELGIPGSAKMELIQEVFSSSVDRGVTATDVSHVLLTAASAILRLRAGMARNIVDLFPDSPMLRELTPRMQVDLQEWSSKAVRSGLPDPLGFVTSGFRSQERQNELIAAWERGDREGLTARPARRSKHTSGEAVDLSSQAPLERLAGIWVSMGNRWGGHFFPMKDPNHFDLG